MRPTNTDPDYMPDRWRRIIQRVAAGEEWRTAARTELCSESYARVIRTRMMKHPAVAKAIESIRQAGRAAAGKTLADRLAQADEDRAFARAHTNAMAAHKSTELQCRLEGRLVDRLEIVPPLDMRKALEEARHRTFGPVNVTPKPSALTDARDTEPDTDGSGSAGSGQDGNGQPFGD